MPTTPIAFAPCRFPKTFARSASDAFSNAFHRRHAMKNKLILAAVAAAAIAALAPLPALADVTIGVSISLTGPTSALGIPTQKGIALWPKEIAGEKLNVILLDDATDPTKGVQNTRKLITED